MARKPGKKGEQIQQDYLGKLALDRVKGIIEDKRMVGAVKYEFVR